MLYPFFVGCEEFSMGFALNYCILTHNKQREREREEKKALSGFYSTFHSWSGLIYLFKIRNKEINRRLLHVHKKAVEATTTKSG